MLPNIAGTWKALTPTPKARAWIAVVVVAAVEEVVRASVVAAAAVAAAIPREISAF